MFHTENTALTEILNFNVHDNFDRPEQKIITSSGKIVKSYVESSNNKLWFDLQNLNSIIIILLEQQPHG